MKICQLCRLEYSDETEFCAKCGNKLEAEKETDTTPRDYEEGY